MRLEPAQQRWYVNPINGHLVLEVYAKVNDEQVVAAMTLGDNFGHSPGYHPRYAERELRRTLMRELEDKLFPKGKA